MFSAMSSARPVILDTLTPRAGCSSYRVMAGPRATLMTRASMPKESSVSSSSSTRFCCSSSCSWSRTGSAAFAGASSDMGGKR